MILIHMILAMRQTSTQKTNNLTHHDHNLHAKVNFSSDKIFVLFLLI